VRLRDIEFTPENSFVAMQYYWLILNRTYLVVFGQKSLVAILGRGAISAEGGADPLTRAITKSLAVAGDLNNPYAYLKASYMDKAKDIDFESDEILAQNKANFRIKYEDIISVSHDPRKKWGMAYYPHDGKVYIETIDGKKIEFIILGAQSGEAIKNMILNKIIH
jgi:hypothetical protein